ncbi:MAG TPA: hypothetical protein VIU41_01685 [Geobacteraceae bacterium]
MKIGIPGRQSIWHKCIAMVMAALLGTGGLLPGMVPASQATQAEPAGDFAKLEPGWPREVEKDGARLVYYQPQVDDWKKYREFFGRVAFMLAAPGEKPVPGVASLKSKTTADQENKTVALQKIKIESVRFPGTDAEKSEQLEKLFEQLFPTEGMTISLDRFAAGLKVGKDAARTVAVNNEPPKIFVGSDPAILLIVDGDPILVPIEGTNLQFVVNTNWNLFFDQKNGRYYLLVDKNWLTTDDLVGKWSFATTLPSGLYQLPTGENWDEVKRNIPARPARGKVPQVFFSDRPAELISFKDAPVYAAIPKTKLLYAKNTESDLFVNKDDRQYYYLVSGRWFRAASLEGPWSFASNDLPADFAKIPPDSPKANVLVSVPGTQEAQDAVLLAQIPTTAVVNRAEAEAKVRVTYDGDPSFVPIEKTTMAYAKNTQEKVIQVGDMYYLCFQGVWFRSISPTGPWKTADSVPAEIYTIPPESPVHNVTYVYASNPTPTTVDYSYTAGYLGMFAVGLAVGAVLVYGTGYYYPPYVYYPPSYYYPIYRPYPYTYGYGRYYYGHYPYPYGYYPYGRYNYGRYAYGPYAGAGAAAWYNPTTGRYGRAATVQTQYGGRTYAQAYNPWTGTYAATHQGSSPYGQWGRTVVQRGSDWAVTNRVTTSQGTVRHTTTSRGGQATTVRGPGGQRATVGRDANNNVYAGKDGNIYRKDSSGNWSKYNNGAWSPVAGSAQSRATQSRGGSQAAPGQSRQGGGGTRASQLPSTGAAPGTSSRAPRYGSNEVLNSLERDSSNRQRGYERTRQYNSGSVGGGVRSSGGGGGRSYGQQTVQSIWPITN